MPALIYTGAGLGIGSLFLTNKILLPMQKKYLDKEVVDNFYQAIVDRGIDNLDEVKKNLKKDYTKHKKETQTNLLNWLDTYYINTPEDDYIKLKDYIMNNYDEYYWNELIAFCLRYSSTEGCQNRNSSCNYENFLKLKDMSEGVYDMWHRTSCVYGFSDLTKNNDKVYEDFKKFYPEREFCEYLFNNWRRDDRGIITDQEVRDFKDFAHKEGHW